MQQDFSPKKVSIGTGLDSIVIRKCIADIQGGRTLDVSDWPEDTIKAGHFIIVKNGVYAPAPVSEGKYVTLIPEKKEGDDEEEDEAEESVAKFVGVNKHTILKSQPAAAIMTRGIVNPEVCPYDMSDVATEFAAACPYISFEKDEEA